MTSDPVELFLQEREFARSKDDPLATYCFVATVDDEGNPSIRTVVLRILDGQLGLFVNASSPKCRDFSISGCIEVLTFFCSVNVQYRFQAQLRLIDPSIVKEFWANRPAVAKKLDAIYGTHPQSTPIESRETLVNLVESTTIPDVAPDSAMGFYLKPILKVERLALDQSDGVHDRRLYRSQAGKWTGETLVP